MRPNPTTDAANVTLPGLAQLYELVGPMLRMSDISQNTLSWLPLQITVYLDNLVSNFFYLKQKQNPESKKYPFIIETFRSR